MKKVFFIAILAFSMNVFAQVSKTVNINAGNLSVALTSSEKQTITNLIITGSIDARDFKIMRDNMPFLAVLDLSEVMINTYSGQEGTAGTTSIIYPANEIPVRAFCTTDNVGKISLNTIKLPSSITSIGNWSLLNCTGLSSVVIPKSVLSVERSAFNGCTNMSSVVFESPSSLTYIDSMAFRNCDKLKTITIPSRVSIIDYCAFYDCNELSSISFDSNSSLTIIEIYAFGRCSKLTNFSILPKITTIGNFAFLGSNALISVDANNPNYSSIDGVLYNKEQTHLIYCPNSKSGNFNIPSSVTTIGEDAFYSCDNLTSIVIPTSVTTIENWAFEDCTGLVSIQIAASVISIAKNAFPNCSGNIIVDENNPNYSSEDGVLFNKKKTTLIFCPISKKGNYNIPASVKVIDFAAFFNCSLLTDISIPSSITTIGSSAFRGCKELNGAIIIPSSVTSIGSYAFGECTKITSINCYNPKPIDLTSSERVFNNINKINCTLNVPKGSAQAYQMAYQWSDFKNIIEMPGITFSSNSVKIESEQGSKATIDITSDVAWKASSDQSWLTVSPVSGSGNDKLTFIATTNPTNTIRTAKVTVSATGIETRTISIVQSYALLPTITKLYDFDWQYPYIFSEDSRLVYDGTYLYGIMHDNSLESKCKLMRIKPDGSNFEILYSFDFNGEVYLTISSNVIYGQVFDYEENYILFRINKDGSNYSIFNFVTDYKIELGYNSLIISNDKIYGSGNENIFVVNTDRSGYKVIYSSKENSFENIVLSGNTIIGNKYGAIKKVIKVNVDGSGFKDYGIESDIPVIVDKSIIYGMKRAYEGTEGYIFKVNIDGTGFTKIKTLSYPEFKISTIGSFSIVGNTLFGMIEDNSLIFKINTDGTGYAKIQHDLDFSKYLTSVELTLVGNELFGFMGSNGVVTTLFKINTLDNKVSNVFKFGTSASGMFPMGTLIESNNSLFGNSVFGGVYNNGTLFKINKDGSGYTKLFDFKDSETGIYPKGQLTLIENTLYGTTVGDDYFGEANPSTDHGCIFKINIDESGYKIIHRFNRIDGKGPVGSLAFYKGCLYGNTYTGGSDGHGTIFKIKPDGSDFTKILDYSSMNTGERSENNIIISNDTIYGISSIDFGSVFSININGTGLRKIFELNDISGDFSYCKPLLINDELYITTSEGGKNDVGTIFKIKTDGTGFTILYNFEGIDNSDGSGFRNNSLQFHNGVLYGTATGNGINDHGYLYSINLDGTGFTKLSDFNGEYGSMPYLCDLIIDDNEDIFGMTTFGGKYSGGIIYKYSLGGSSTSVRDIKEDLMVQVYPNPTNGNLQLRFEQTPESEAWITVYDISGKTILKTQVFNKEENIYLNGNQPGLYLIKVTQGTSNKTYKIVLE